MNNFYEFIKNVKKDENFIEKEFKSCLIEIVDNLSELSLWDNQSIFQGLDLNKISSLNNQDDLVSNKSFLNNKNKNKNLEAESNKP